MIIFLRGVRTQIEGEVGKGEKGKMSISSSTRVSVKRKGRVTLQLSRRASVVG